jgi:hypothetical protein
VEEVDDTPDKGQQDEKIRNIGEAETAEVADIKAFMENQYRIQRIGHTQTDDVTTDVGEYRINPRGDQRRDEDITQGSHPAAEDEDDKFAATEGVQTFAPQGFE